MIKMIFSAVIVTVLFSLSGCMDQQKQVTEKPNITNQKGDSTAKPTEPLKNDQPTTNPSEPSSPDDHSPQPHDPTSAYPVYHNEVFKDVVVSESGDQIVVAGKAQVFEGVFQYALYNGGNLLVEDHYQTAGAPAWGEFEITFKKALIAKPETKLQLFIYSAKDGSKEKTLEIPISNPQKQP